MLSTISKMYITLMPAIFAGILNMVWCKAPLAKSLSKPIDANRTLRDGQPIFGENKTYKGFVGMIIFGTVLTALWGEICAQSADLQAQSFLYVNHENTFLYNCALGALFGLSYAAFELPNSFLKRRLKISPGKPKRGALGAFFVFLDQADSVFGMVLVVAAVYPMPLYFYLGYVLLGAATHLVLNMLLYKLHLRKNPF